MKVVAVVPARDEAARIARVVKAMPAVVSTIVVIDDGSRDDTGAIARGAGERVEVMRNRRSLGVGAAIALGYRRAVALDADVAVVLAGDAQMDPRDLEALIAPIARGEADYVKGNRFAWANGARAFPVARRVGVAFFSAATRLATGLAVDDTQCGYTAAGRRALDEVARRDPWPSYGYPNDLLSRFSIAGLRVVEVPVRPIFDGERSKLRLRHLPGIGFVVARALVRRLLAR